jgi:hypothetical protein
MGGQRGTRCVESAEGGFATRTMDTRMLVRQALGEWSTKKVTTRARAPENEGEPESGYPV